MSIELDAAQSRMPRTLNCPDCGAPMRLMAIMPATTPPRTDEITYRCDACKIELKRCQGRADLRSDLH